MSPRSRAHDREGAARPVPLSDLPDAGAADPARRRRRRQGRGGPAARGGRGDEDGEYPARREDRRRSRRSTRRPATAWRSMRSSWSSNRAPRLAPPGVTQLVSGSGSGQAPSERASSVPLPAWTLKQVQGDAAEAKTPRQGITVPEQCHFPDTMPSLFHLIPATMCAEGRSSRHENRHTLPSSPRRAVQRRVPRPLRRRAGLRPGR